MKTMAVRAKRPNILKNQRGLATVESIPLLIIFVLLTGFAMGMWGAVHSAILQSIAARTYAFETFRNRTNLTIFRENPISGQDILSYVNKGVRYHSVKSEQAQDNREGFFATERSLSIGYPAPTVQTREDVHTQQIYNIQPRNQTVEVGPIWVMVGYGMCLDAQCGQ